MGIERTVHVLQNPPFMSRARTFFPHAAERGLVTRQSVEEIIHIYTCTAIEYRSKTER